MEQGQDLLPQFDGIRLMFFSFWTRGNRVPHIYSQFCFGKTSGTRVSRGPNFQNYSNPSLLFNLSRLLNIFEAINKPNGMGHREYYVLILFGKLYYVLYM